MISEEIEKCITKYFFQLADVKDLDLLNNWIEDKENQVLLKEYVKTNFAINLTMSDPNIEEFKKQLIKEIRKQKNPFYRYKFSIIKYAAVAIIFLGLGYFFEISLNQSQSEEVTITPRKDEIILKLDNGDIKIITEDGSSKVLNSKGEVVGQQNGKELVYDEETQKSKIEYNTLSIPNGKRFRIILSDGSIVHLNSGSTLTYPVMFHKDSIRKVSLIGEAFFDVAHNPKNKFIVNTQELNVQVYGTKFNVSNYPENENTEVVLVQGSVSMIDSKKQITNHDDEFFLNPGHKGSFNRGNKEITDEKVNTHHYTSWVDGNLVFRNTSFYKITQQLERSYNVIIINNNKKLAKETFNATVETKYETIEQVLNYFNKVYQIQYSIVENKVIIN